VSPSKKVLLGQRTSQGDTFWWLPGGSVEPGESDFAAAVRELGEEMQLPVGLKNALATFSISSINTYEYQSNAYNIIFVVPVQESDTLSVPSILDEFEKLMWHDAKQLPANMSVEFKRLEEQWKQWFYSLND
jgi:8-oxo-dGTP pyrophosphatase MutT (NUDIX family)